MQEQLLEVCNLDLDEKMRRRLPKHINSKNKRVAARLLAPPTSTLDNPLISAFGASD